MSAHPSRRLIGAGLLSVIAAGPALAAQPKAKPKAKPAAKAAFLASPDDMTMGSPKAPVTVVEYASVGCPHCAHWDMEVFDAFKAKYIDTGQVRFVYREILAGSAVLAAAGFITARCAPPEQYFPIVREIYRQQQTIAESGDFRTGLLKIAQGAGVDEAAWRACIGDTATFNAVQDRSAANSDLGQVEFTPTFVINGVKLVGDPTLEAFGKAIAAAKRKR